MTAKKYICEECEVPCYHEVKHGGQWDTPIQTQCLYNLAGIAKWREIDSEEIYEK